MQRRRSFCLVVLAVVALLAAVTAPILMGRVHTPASPAAMASMPGMAHHEGGGGAPCAQGCCAICQALPAPSERSSLLLRVLAVTFPPVRDEPGRSVLLERSTPPPRLA